MRACAKLTPERLWTPTRKVCEICGLKRRGWEVNHKRVGRIMREDNLLCRRRRKFVVTTDSNHSFRVYPNLAKDMKLTGIDQLWRADMTYIRLETEFVYLTRLRLRPTRCTAWREQHSG